MPRIRIALLALLAGLAALAASAPGALALSPWWHVNVGTRPSTLKSGTEGEVLVQALNVGDAPTSEPITVTDTLPEGVTVEQVEPEAGKPEPKVSFKENASNMGPEEEGRFFGFGLGPTEALGFFHACSEPAPRQITCRFYEAYPGFHATLEPYEDLEMAIAVKAQSAIGREGEVEVTGGSAPARRLGQSLRVSEAAPAFGVEQFSMVPEAEGGAVDAQAGSHPFQLTVSLALNQNADPLAPPALTRNLSFNLPTGFVGNPTAIPQCTETDFTTIRGGLGDICPQNTAIGIATFAFDEPKFGGEQTVSVPLFNLVPARGEPARFGFEFVGVPVEIKTSVRTGSDYGVTATVSNITQLANFQAETVTFWGVPDARSHDSVRGWGCLFPRFGQAAIAPCTSPDEPNPPPFLTMPTSCVTPWTVGLEGASWPTRERRNGPAITDVASSSYSLTDNSGSPVAIRGCNQIPFRPTISVSPDVQEGSSPSGLAVDVHVPQEVSENPLGLSSSSVRDITVALPPGVAIDPAGGGGLEACSQAQIGYLGKESGEPAQDLFTAGLPAPFCPDGSKIATARIKTPLLPEPLEGAVYLATQDQNPFSSLLAMYLVAEDPVAGVLVKLPGQVSLNQQTGQVTTTFQDSPELPFEDAELHFFGGERAPLGTPASCGAYTTRASFAPWAGNEPVDSTSTFDITSGPNGRPCAGQSLPFVPELSAGASSIQAGGFSPFTMTMSREDGNQSLDAITLHMPPGLSGVLTGVELCPEPQADEGTCGPNSLIGETTVSVGLGGDPFTVTGGRVYITGPYKGAPYGLSIVNPAKAGPFDLENTTRHHPSCDCLVVRAKIEVDPVTAALTVTSDTSGDYRIPTILEGIPLDIKHVNVTINRPGFTFNPTNCSKMAITGDLTSSEGAVDQLSVPFQATNCATLGFKPQFSVATSAHHTRTNGTNLDVKLTYPKAPFGSQANIGKVRVELPKQLPSRLTTLQKACTDTVFNSNPENCPAASKVGEAVATTPIIPERFSGPAYFVSHGGAKFPELIIALHGYALTVDLHGETFISKAGVTSTTFNTVPDVPIGTFELKLPAGPDSALAGNGDLCASKLVMPTTFTAQNGAVVRENTPIAVQGCTPEIRVVRHRVKGKRATVVVSVPSAGTLVAGGHGLSQVRRGVRGAGTVTVSLRLSKADQRFVANHHGRRLMAPIRLSFMPSRGKRLEASVAVLMR